MVRTPEPVDAVDAAERVAEAMIQLWRQAHLEIAPDVSDQQMRTLLVLEAGARNLTGLAREMGVGPSSATRLCDRLGQRGLIERVSAGRQVSIRLSRTGERLLEATRRHRRLLLRRALAATGTDQAVLHDALGQLCDLFAAPDLTAPDSASPAVPEGPERPPR
ncbi:MarR family transcriptional regulator [Streptomyces sp. NPDC052687]|uniref:MarR family winged helix-turn-helix transcriptional regulator n=1 Tax=Streptomyces sp. NPDC052687 TaxID=3154759 RepID=UPI00342D86AF